MEDDAAVLLHGGWSRPLGSVHRGVVRAVLDDVLSRDDVLGVMLAGSIVRGEGGPTSDLDVYVVVSSPWRQRRQLLLDGVPVEVFINPPWTIRSYFADEAKDGAPSTAHMLATGVVLYARDGTLEGLRDEARHILAQGPAALTDEELTQRCYFLVDLSEDADDVRENDPDALAFVLPMLVERAVALLYARARRWLPKPKRLPTDLEGFDPDAAALLRAYLHEPDLLRRYSLACALVERAIAPRPRRFFSWDSAPEEVPTKRGSGESTN